MSAATAAAARSQPQSNPTLEFEMHAAFDGGTTSARLRNLLGISVGSESVNSIRTNAEIAAQTAIAAAAQVAAAAANPLDLEDDDFVTAPSAGMSLSSSSKYASAHPGSTKKGSHTPNKTRMTPSRPSAKDSFSKHVYKHGHEVMSPRVARLLRVKGAESLSEHAATVGVPAPVFLPYSSRHPHELPLRMISFREYARTGGNVLPDADMMDGAGKVPKKTGMSNSKDKAEKRLRQTSCKIIACPDTIPGLFLNEEERRLAAIRFNREIGIVTKRKGEGGPHSAQSRRRRPPTPGLPCDKTERPAERLHLIAASFAKSRESADESLLQQLDIIERERADTLARKKIPLGAGAPRANWSWVSEIRKIRLMADCARLEDMMMHAKRHVWYTGLIRDVNDLGVEATAVQVYICDFIYRLVSFGCEFDSNALLLLLSSLEPKEFHTKEVQDMLHKIRLHTETSLEKLEEWTEALGLGVSEEFQREREHERLHQLRLLEEKTAMQHAMKEHQQKQRAK
jgi:hypothetical protein